MRRLISLVLLISATGLLAGCQTSLSGKAPGDVTPNAVTGGEIETTALDAVPGGTEEPAAVPEAVAAQGSDTAGKQSDPRPVSDGQGADAKPATDAGAKPVAEATDPAPKPDLDAVPVALKSEKQLACEKKKGRWAKVGSGDVRACVYLTKDSGKRCERESQCDSVCLARSGTCAPFKPMYGCNEILQDNGARVTQCLD